MHSRQLKWVFAPSNTSTQLDLDPTRVYHHALVAYVRGTKVTDAHSPCRTRSSRHHLFLLGLGMSHTWGERFTFFCDEITKPR